MSAFSVTASTVAGTTRPAAPRSRPASSSAAREIAERFGQTDDDEIAERVTRELAGREPVLERGRPRSVVAREGDETLAQVTRRRDAEIAPQPARRSAVVGDADDRGERRGVVPCGAQRDRETVSAAECDDVLRGRLSRHVRRPGGAPRCGDRGDGTVATSCSPIATLRWRPPVQPNAIERYDLPSRS